MCSWNVLTNAHGRSYDLGPVDDILAKPISPQEVFAAVEGLKRGNLLVLMVCLLSILDMVVLFLFLG